MKLTNTRRGFTLIELLVVVLIIGILAAVAVPQYQKAVEKSKATQAFAFLKSLYEAGEVYHMANGTWPEKFEDLDVQVPWTGNTKWVNTSTDVRSNEEWSAQLFNRTNIGHGVMMGRVSGKYAGAGLVIWWQYLGSTNMPEKEIVCAERQENGLLFSSELTAGDYCHGFFNGTLITGMANRYYKLPQ